MVRGSLRLTPAGAPASLSLLSPGLKAKKMPLPTSIFLTQYILLKQQHSRQKPSRKGNELGVGPGDVPNTRCSSQPPSLPFSPSFAALYTARDLEIAREDPAGTICIIFFFYTNRSVIWASTAALVLVQLPGAGSRCRGPFSAAWHQKHFALNKSGPKYLE